jgi:phosphatidylserine/phosphatidylglycerophosphate/cardiolipin synthase-like enzyme
MRNKFFIIDKSVVINGSYNWTNNARTNHENITVNYNNKNLTHEFITEFNNIFNTSAFK